MRTIAFRKCILGLGAAFISLFSIISCNDNLSSGDGVQYVPVQEEEDGSWIFIDRNGKPVGDQKWEYEPSLTINGIFTSQDDEGLTVYKWDGNRATPVDSLRNMVSVGILNDGLMPVTPPMQRIRVVDANGRMKFTLDPIGGREITSCAVKFSDGLLVVSTAEGKDGVVNTKGEVVVKPDKFDEISNYNGGYALAAIFNHTDSISGPRYFILDKEGNSKEVKGDFGFWEGDCTTIPEFENGVAYVPGRVIEVYKSREEDAAEQDAKAGVKKTTVKKKAPKKKKKKDEEEEPEQPTYYYSEYKITTDGKVSVKDDGISWFKLLPNGGSIVNTYKNEVNSYTWTGKDGKVIMKTQGLESSIFDYGRYVAVEKNDSYTVYSLDGEELYKLQNGEAPYWSQGSFGLVTARYGDSYSNTPTLYSLLNEEGEPVDEDVKYYGVGTNLVADLYGDEIGCEQKKVTSAYVDIEGAAKRFASMLTGSVKGKADYHLGQYATSILSGTAAENFTGETKTFDIPTDSSYYLATGPGYWIQGTAETNDVIAQPKYKSGFKLAYIDEKGQQRGEKTQQVVSVNFNKSAKIIAFYLRLQTNHPSGEELKEAVTKILKAQNYTLESEGTYYEEYTDGKRNIIIYGSYETDGIGAVVYDKSSGFSLSDEEISNLTAEI